VIRSLLLGGVALLLGLFVVLPLGLLGREVGGFEAALAEGPAAWNTLLFTGGAVLLALGLGVPLGLGLARGRLPAGLEAAIVLPYAIPPYVTTLAWIALGNPTTGLLRPLLPLNIYSLSGMIWVMGLHLSPFVILGVRDAVARLDPSLAEAAQVAGASPGRVLRDVTLPLLSPAVLAAAGFVSSAAAASFGVPYLLSSAAAEPVPVLTTRIYQALELAPDAGRPLAVTLSLGLLTVGVGLPALLRLTQGGRSFTSARTNRQGAAPASPLLTGAVLLYLFLAVGLPVATILWTSLAADLGGGLSLDNLTLSHWQTVSGQETTQEALLRSLGLAAAAATATVAVGTLLAHTVERAPSRFAQGLAALARAPYAVPGTVLALGLLLSTSQELRLIVAERLTITVSLADTLWLLLLAYSVKLLALPLDSARAALQGLHPSLEEGARIAGASWLGALRDVTLPLLAPSLRTAWVLVFLPAFCEVTLSVLLRGPRTEVLGTRLFSLESYGAPQQAAVLALLVTLVVAGGLLLTRPRQL